VYRLRARPHPLAEAGGHFICDEGRYGYHFTNSGERITRPLVKAEGRFQRAAWPQLLPQLREELASTIQSNPESTSVVLSPFLTIEEAYLIALCFKTISPKIQLVLGPVPVIGVDDRYPKNVQGQSIEPTKFTIRAEKCPNRQGVEAILQHFEGRVIPFVDVISQPRMNMWFTGGYPDKQAVESTIPTTWQPPALIVAQDLFPTLLTAAAKYVLPATSSFEKEGTFINHAGIPQQFPRAVTPPSEVRSELQLAHDLSGRRGLAQAHLIRAELASVIPRFATLASSQH
jgi:NADH-quinone oxidoreductase subunit G